MLNWRFFDFDHKNTKTNFMFSHIRQEGIVPQLAAHNIVRLINEQVGKEKS
jgi:ethanolamine ammonia-lyase small subunit